MMKIIIKVTMMMMMILIHVFKQMPISMISSPVPVNREPARVYTPVIDVTRADLRVNTPPRAVSSVK
jgi:hypothetical protein